MPDLIIKPAAQSGNKVIIQDQAGGAVITTADSGATIADGIALGTPASGVATNLTGIPAANLTGTVAAARLPNHSVIQVVSGNFTAAGAEETSHTMQLTADYVDITITAGNKVLVLYSGAVKGRASGNDFCAVRWGILRNETAGPSQTDLALFERQHVVYSSDWTAQAAYNYWTASCSYLDTPTSTTTGIRYNVTVANYDHVNSLYSQIAYTTSGVGTDIRQRQLTLMEIQA
jgi:hypothetical protein